MSSQVVGKVESIKEIYRLDLSEEEIATLDLQIAYARQFIARDYQLKDKIKIVRYFDDDERILKESNHWLAAIEIFAEWEDLETEIHQEGNLFTLLIKDEKHSSIYRDLFHFPQLIEKINDLEEVEKIKKDRRIVMMHFRETVILEIYSRLEDLESALIRNDDPEANFGQEIHEILDYLDDNM